ncbi:MAG: amidohydrolase [Pseudomonadota bacterium]|nr:amidohydrolase [Pseudomonadota bacterium]
MPINNMIADYSGQMRQWRHYLHAHPELAFEEHHTADFIAGKLTEFGIEVHRGMAKTGVIGVIRGKSGGNRCIGLRADIDALPIHEDNSFAHKSGTEGVMHACGHDGHTTMLLGAAKYLAENPHFDGNVVVIFQPAEENGGGGKVMCDEGLFKQFPMETVWGMHNWPGLDVGKAAIQRGPSMAAADGFTITLKGRGGHAAMPHLTADPIYAAATLIQSLQSVVSRHLDPLDQAVLSVTQCHGGFTHNVIPDDTFIEGTARYFRPDIGAIIKDRMAHITEQIAAAHGCSVQFEWIDGYPPTINDAAAADRAALAAADVLESGSIVMDAPPSMGA